MLGRQFPQAAFVGTGDHEEVGFRVIRAAEPLDSAAVVRTPRRSLQGRSIVESLLLADREAMNQLTARLVEDEEFAGFISYGNQIAGCAADLA